MQQNVDDLASHVVGHRIVSVEKEMIPRRGWFSTTALGHERKEEALVLTLDTGRRVVLKDTDDCCAYTELKSFILNADKIDHIITGVGTTDGFEKWHIYADFGDVLELQVGWSCGNPFYYAYGFDIEVVDVDG